MYLANENKPSKEIHYIIKGIVHLNIIFFIYES